MKIRIGFVSNSSTTSFCIFGCQVDSYEAAELLLKAGSITQEQADSEEKWDVYYEAAEKVGMTSHQPENWDQVFFGFALASIPDDAVFGEWKKEKEKLLKEFLGNDIECSILEEGYQN